MRKTAVRSVGSAACPMLKLILNIGVGGHLVWDPGVQGFDPRQSLKQSLAWLYYVATHGEVSLAPARGDKQMAELDSAV